MQTPYAIGRGLRQMRPSPTGLFRARGIHLSHKTSRAANVAACLIVLTMPPARCAPTPPCRGWLSNKAIAAKLNLSEKTVKIHISAIFKALDVVNRAQAAAVVCELGIV